LTTSGGELVEDQLTTVTGNYSATSIQSGADWWLMQLVAFRANSGGGDTTPPSSPTGLTATVASSTQIGLSWTASTDNVGVAGYRIQRCQGASCSSFAQIGTSTTTTYTDAGLTPSTGYSYRVQATDAAGNLSGFSNIFSGTTPPDSTPPTTPTGLTATVVSSSQINLSWTPSTDNVGVTGYLIQRCQGASCISFAQIGSSTITNYTDMGLLPATSYSYRIQATDAAGNLSGFSTTVSGTTLSSGVITPPVITSPSSGTTILTGQSLTVSASISAGAFPYGVVLIAPDPLGATDIQIVGAGTTVSFDLPIPVSTPPGPYLLTVVGMNSAGSLVPSTQLAIQVERADQPVALTPYPSAITMTAVGDSRSLLVIGAFPGNAQIDITNSSKLAVASANSSIASVQNGTITAVASGMTSITLQYGSITTVIPITVP
jgi:chitodextrinase